MLLNRILISSLTLCFLVSCSSNESAETKPQLRRDTPIVKREPVNPFSPIDISPMDMSYYPVDYPLMKMAGKASAPPVMRVIYSRPHRQGRQIFGKLLKYGEPWRLGANEATEIEFFRNVTINQKTVAAGRYIIYCIPFTDKWTIVLNSYTDTWGLQVNKSKDVQSFDIPVARTETNIEYFTMVFEKATGGADLIMTWDDTIARLPIKFSEK